MYIIHQVIVNFNKITLKFTKVHIINKSVQISSKYSVQEKRDRNDFLIISLTKLGQS